MLLRYTICYLGSIMMIGAYCVGGVSTQLITSALVAHENSAFKKNDSACLI